MIRWVVSLAYTEIAPFTPACTIAALDVTAPVRAFSVETSGCGEAAGQVLKYPSGPVGTTVMLNAYAWALAGIPQLLEGTGNVRGTPAPSAGPPRVPVELGVSARRQGGT